MKFILLFALILYNQLLFCQCGGKERWEVKTLQDDLASTVTFKPVKTSVESLTKMKLPQKIGPATPRLKAELKTYTVYARVKEYFKEADGDIHIVLQDINKPQLTMIAEMPDYDCDKVSGSGYEDKFKEARKHFNSLDKKHVIKGNNFYFTGVAFFDIRHGTPQRGVSKLNGIELHPVLNFHE
jgi:hypothetical protein